MKHLKHHPRVVAGLLGLCGLAFALILVLVQGPRLAQADDKIFAPQACVPIDPEFGGIGDAAVRVGEIEQTTQVDYQTFICPLVRDAVTGSLDDVWVRVNNENADEDTPPVCCVHSVSLGGGLHDYECQVAPDTETHMSLRFKLDDFTEFDYGHYVVTCELGLEDTIISIRTRE